MDLKCAIAYLSLTGFLVVSAKASVAVQDIHSDVLSQRSKSVPTLVPKLKSCMKSGNNKNANVKFSDTRHVLLFNNVVEKTDIEKIPSEDRIFSNRTAFSYLIPLNKEKREEKVIKGDLDVHLYDFKEDLSSSPKAINLDDLLKSEENMEKEILRQREINEEGGYAQYCLRLSRVVVLHANRFTHLSRRTDNTSWLAQGDLYRKSASILIGGMDHRNDEELKAGGLDPAAVLMMNDKLRSLYLESLRLAIDSFGNSIRYSDANFHESCSYYLRTLQALLHENEYEVYDELLNNLKGMLPDRVYHIHGDPSECPECLEVIRNIGEKEMTLKWLMDSEKKGIDAVVYANKELKKQNKELLDMEVVHVKRKNKQKKDTVRKISTHVKS